MNGPRRFVGFVPKAILALRHTTLIQEHAEDAAFLWTRRAGAVRSSKYKLRDLARLDERIEAHLQGLVAAGEDGWAAAEKQLADGEAGEVFVAICLACLVGRPKWLELALEGGRSEPRWPRAVASAMGWVSWTSAARPARMLVEGGGEQERLAGLGAYRVHRQDPGHMLLKLLDDPAPRVRAMSARLVGELGLAANIGALRVLLSDSTTGVRLAAAWSLARLGAAPQNAAALLLTWGQDACKAAVDMAARCMSREEVLFLVRELRTRAKPWLSFVAAAAAGWPDLVEDLIVSMTDDRLARAAGAAFCQITGADLEYLDLTREPSAEEEEEGDRSGNPADDFAAFLPPVPLDLRDDLPLPDPQLVSKWWRKCRGSWNTRERYLAGRPIERTGLREALQDGTQPQRRAAALELGMKNPTADLYSTSRPGFGQARELLGWT